MHGAKCFVALNKASTVVVQLKAKTATAGMGKAFTFAIGTAGVAIGSLFLTLLSNYCKN